MHLTISNQRGTSTNRIDVQISSNICIFVSRHVTLLVAILNFSISGKLTNSICFEIIEHTTNIFSNKNSFFDVTTKKYSKI